MIRPRGFFFNSSWQQLLFALPPEVLFHAAIFSPPYNIGVPYDVYGDRVSRDDWLEEADQLARALRDRVVVGGSLWINLAFEKTNPAKMGYYLEEFRRYGWIVQNHIAWIKAATSLDDAGEDFNWGHHRPLNHEGLIWSGYEHLYHLVRSDDYPVKLNREAIGVPFSDKSNIKRFGHARDLRCRGNVWEIPYKVNQSKDHPAQFRVELPWRCMMLMDGTIPGAPHQVLDPYGGVGNTALAAALLGWEPVLCDISPAYCAKAVEKWNNLWI